MPRRKNPEDGRTARISVSVRFVDYIEWNLEAISKKMSVSRLLYIRAMATKPMPSAGHLELAKQLGRLGVLLNQAMRQIHAEGLDATNLAEVLSLTHQIRQRLEG
jgi:hypothetical protein